jgi:ectoine hydroxylase-related dioxygenase (phytanoyl-CoA dioxygenase family)
MAAEGFAAIDFQAFHREQLPALLADGRGREAARAALSQGSLAFRLPGGEAWTYLPRPDGMALAAGDAEAETVVELDRECWEGLVHDYESAPGLLYGGRVRCARGNAMRFVGWEPALRRLYADRPLYDPDGLRLLDHDGRPLDPDRTFTLDDDPEHMAHFLRTAGYLFVRRVFGAAEVADFLSEARELRSEARPGDRLSWWAEHPGGEKIVCRVTRAADKVRLATLRSDERIARLVALADEKLVHRCGEGNGVTVIFKTPGIREGLSDLPWHRDCGMGGHSIMCPVLIASVFLTPGTPETGELRFLPGSWTRSCGFMESGDERAPRSAGFAAEPGDVSIHYGDGMHAAPPPTRDDLPAYRVSAVVGFGRPGDQHHHRGDKSYNDVLHQRRDGRIEHLAKVAERA